MVGLYFSGNGNTKYCIQKFADNCAEKCSLMSIEDFSLNDTINQDDFIVLAHPVYFSNLPKIVRDFINGNGDFFKGKKVFIIATMGLFSGDGAGCSARLLKKCGANVVGGLHIKMPDCVGDVKALKRTMEQNRRIIKRANKKISKAAVRLSAGAPPQEGLSIFHHLAGLFCQRLWFYNETKEYTDRLKIDSEKCTGCGLCIPLCPMNNLSSENKMTKAKDRCTMCYRCINSCPSQAITLLGKRVVEQCRIEKYTS